MKPLSRRSVTTGLAAAVTAIPAVGLCKGVEGPSELAALIRRYYEEVDAFSSVDHLTDAAADAHADATFNATMAEMIGVPARTANDALAAMEWLLREGADSMIDFDPHGTLWTRTCLSLVNAVRDYLAARVTA